MGSMGSMGSMGPAPRFQGVKCGVGEKMGKSWGEIIYGI
jgi:hypothetical protein